MSPDALIANKFLRQVKRSLLHKLFVKKKIICKKLKWKKILIVVSFSRAKLRKAKSTSQVQYLLLQETNSSLVAVGELQSLLFFKNGCLALITRVIMY